MSSSSCVECERTAVYRRSRSSSPQSVRGSNQDLCHRFVPYWRVHSEWSRSRGHISLHSGPRRSWHSRECWRECHRIPSRYDFRTPSGHLLHFRILIFWFPPLQAITLYRCTFLSATTASSARLVRPICAVKSVWLRYFNLLVGLFTFANLRIWLLIPPVLIWVVWF